MPDDSGFNPQAGDQRITDRNTDLGDYRANSILGNFLDFGYSPTKAEAQSLVDTWHTGAVTAVAMYVNQQKAEQQRVANDPLAALQSRVESDISLNQAQIKGLSGQLQDVLGSAPQLFGNLTPDQIQTYLTPLKTAFDAQVATVQSVQASRGTGGSSAEATALAQTNKQFQEEVFSTGLNVGLTSQQNKATALQKQIDNLFGLTGTEQQIAGAAAGQRSGQNLSQSNLIASLPFFLDQASFQKQMALQAAQSSAGGGGIGSLIGGGIGGAIGAFGGPVGAAAGYSIGSSLGGTVGNQISPAKQGGYTSPYSAPSPYPGLFLASSMRGPNTPANPSGSPYTPDLYGNASEGTQNPALL